MNSSSGKRRRTSQHNKEVSAANKAKKRKMKVLTVASAFGLLATVSTTSLFVSASRGNANDCQLIGNCVVPEISALEGTAALAVVASLLLLAWERRRRVV